MRDEDIDRIIQRYTEERRHEKRQVVQSHFLSRAYLLSKGEVEQFLKHTRGMLVYYIDSLSLFDNPFRNSQVLWLLFMFVVFIFSLCMTSDETLRWAGIIISIGTVIFGTSLWRMVWNHWLDVGYLIACYREIIDLIDSLQHEADGAEAAA